MTLERTPSQEEIATQQAPRCELINSRTFFRQILGAVLAACGGIIGGGGAYLAITDEPEIQKIPTLERLDREYEREQRERRPSAPTFRNRERKPSEISDEELQWMLEISREELKEALRRMGGTTRQKTSRPEAPQSPNEPSCHEPQELPFLPRMNRGKCYPQDKTAPPSIQPIQRPKDRAPINYLGRSSVPA